MKVQFAIEERVVPFWSHAERLLVIIFGADGRTDEGDIPQRRIF